MTPDEVDLLTSPEGRALLDRLAEHLPADDLAVMTRLRAEGVAPALVSVVVTQVRLRQRARARFGADADRLLWTPAGLEQATRTAVADHRARRFAAADVHRVADLCCGVGGDLLALARAGLAVFGVDHDPATVAVARANADSVGLTGSVEVRCADVVTLDLAADGCDAAFVDPARRSGGRRTFDPQAYSPPYSFVADLAARVPATAAKVAPGIPHSAVPAGVEAEWVSDGGDVKEACLWHGPLATPGVSRRATLLPSGATLTDEGMPEPTVGPVGRWLVEPDGAVIRAGLVAAVGGLIQGRLLDPAIAYLTSDVEPRTPYGRTFEVLDELPFARKRLRAALRERGCSDVVVKKRGIAVVPEELRRDLRLTGDGPTATLVLTRTAAGPLALLVHPR